MPSHGDEGAPTNSAPSVSDVLAHGVALQRDSAPGEAVQAVQLGGEKEQLEDEEQQASESSELPRFCRMSPGQAVVAGAALAILALTPVIIVTRDQSTDVTGLPMQQRIPADLCGTADDCGSHGRCAGCVEELGRRCTARSGDVFACAQCSGIHKDKLDAAGCTNNAISDWCAGVPSPPSAHGCVCDDYWTGHRCEIDACGTTDGCGPHGTCVTDNHGAGKCVCTERYTGSTCATEPLECCSKKIGSSVGVLGHCDCCNNCDINC